MRITSLQDRLATVVRQAPGSVERNPRRLVCVGIAIALAGLGAPASQAFSRTTSTPTLRASRTFVIFNHHVELSGTASTQKVTLLARHFGQTSYRTVATARVRGGHFDFSPIPGLATSYEVTTGTRSIATSRPVTVYVHLDVVHYGCSLCRAPQVTTQRQLHYSVVVRVPSSDYRFVLSEPVWLYVGTSAGRISSERRVGRVKPVGLGHSTIRFRGSIPTYLPAGWRLRFTACDRAQERRTGVGLPSVHDCGASDLSHRQFLHYVG